MLHTLLLVLKIIGIILAVILGILLLLIAIVIFVPIRYEISAKCDGDVDSLKAKVKATWLLHLLRADVFLKGKKLKWTVRLGWIKKSNTVINQVPEEKKKDEPENHEFQKVEEENIGGNQPEETLESIDEKQNKDKIDDSKQDEVDKNKTCANDKKETLRDKVNRMIQKVKDLFEKKEKITTFISDESHVNAFNRTKKILFILLKRLKPGEVKGKVRFGFEDPAMTGKVLGGISMFYAVFEDALEIIPDFEKQILKGTIYLRGKIRICHFVSAAVKLILCKDVRITYRDIRNFKL